MRLVWKLLRQHVSIAQLVGFVFANLMGMLIICLTIQFYRDILPAFSPQEGFIRDDYLIISKKVSTLDGIMKSSTSFDSDEIEKIARQPFCTSLAPFTASRYRVRALIGMRGGNSVSTDMFFESVPDDFIDVKTDDWHFSAPDITTTPADDRQSMGDVPIILPRDYLNLYNFGFAETKALPKISEDLAKKIDIILELEGFDGRQIHLTGHVVGFSNRLNTILVPQTFIDWSNKNLTPKTSLQTPNSTRLIMKVSNPTDPKIVEFMKKHKYDIADDKLDAGKTMFLVKIISALVIAVGLLICTLSFYILMLSIYLLVQKNVEKLRSLLMIGYSPRQVAMPYQILTIGLNAVVFVLACIFLVTIRYIYMGQLGNIISEKDMPSVFPTLLIGFGLFVVVSVLNIMAVKRKVVSVW